MPPNFVKLKLRNWKKICGQDKEGVIIVPFSADLRITMLCVELLIQ